MTNSTLPAYPYPYFGNNIIETLEELMDRDRASDYKCAICGKELIVSEGIIEGTDSQAFLLCEFCHSVVGDIDTITKAEQDAVYEAYGTIADQAINPENSDNEGYPWV